MAAIPPVAAERGAADGPIAEETRKGLALRARYGIAAPARPPTVHVHSVSSHHVSEEWSTIASRDARGRWTASHVGEESSGLLRIETRPIAEERTRLSGAQGRRLDALLASPELYRHIPEQLPDDIGVGAQYHVMEIVTPRGRTVVRWMGRLRGLKGQVADLVMRHD